MQDTIGLSNQYIHSHPIRGIWFRYMMDATVLVIVIFTKHCYWSGPCTYAGWFSSPSFSYLSSSLIPPALSYTQPPHLTNRQRQTHKQNSPTNSISSSPSIFSVRQHRRQGTMRPDANSNITTTIVTAPAKPPTSILPSPLSSPSQSPSPFRPKPNLWTKIHSNYIHFLHRNGEDVNSIWILFEVEFPELKVSGDIVRRVITHMSWNCIFVEMRCGEEIFGRCDELRGRDKIKCSYHARG